jgi:hypothetical protein
MSGVGVGLLPAFAVACALLAVAGVAKLRAPRPAREAVALIGVRVPAAAIRAMGALEVGVAVFAAVRPGVVAGGLVAFAYAGFTLTVLLLLRADRSADCGCFGQASSVASAAHVALNAGACGVAIGAALVSPPGLQWIVTRTPLVAVTLVIALAGAAFAAYAAFTLFAPAWRAYSSGSGT